MKEKLKSLVFKGLSRFARICPKSGRIIAFTPPKNVFIILFPLIGVLSIIWFLMRTVPKPSRVAYPCQKIAAGIGVSFITWVIGIFSSMVLFKKLKSFFKRFSMPGTTLIIIMICVVMATTTVFVLSSIINPSKSVYADWNPSEGANKPIGVAQGIYPGRVTWSYNPDATVTKLTGNWFQTGNTNQQVVKDMFTASIKALTGTNDVKTAWDNLFKYYNQKKGKGNIGYQSGETIAIKINTVNTYAQNKYTTAIDACGETVLAMVDQLVTAGIPQASIIVYDGGVGTIGDYVYNCVNKVYPQVRFEATSGWGNIKTIQWVDNGITFSSMASTNADTRRVAKTVWDATYLINLALLKKHEDQTAVTLCGKNHFGSIKNCRDMHAAINDQTKGMGTYNCLVDLAGHDHIGGKTVLYVIDGLWGSDGIAKTPRVWNTAPFNGRYPSSIFMSEDFVAIDSVGLDFINSEWTLWDNGDNYLHEAAQANNPPSGIVYDPEKDGTRLQSLGVHEHWNNAQDKQYSRNLGTGNGIELIKVGQTQPTQTPTPTTSINLGDANNNGTVDIVDALLVAQYSVGIIPTVFNTTNADVNKDGQISIVDALLIAQKSVGIVVNF